MLIRPAVHHDSVQIYAPISHCWPVCPCKNGGFIHPVFMFSPSFGQIVVANKAKQFSPHLYESF